MQKKFSEEKINEILETGISEFALYGPDKANINIIAKKADISVGVLYKYFGSKEEFFFACLKKSLEALDAALDAAFCPEDSIENFAYKLACSIRNSAAYADYTRMYQMISTSADEKYASFLADEIESKAAKAYTDYFSKLHSVSGLPAKPAELAFFFDNLLMMLQFSYCSPYYRRRYEIYTGISIEESNLPEVFSKVIGGYYHGLCD